jgi:hypothetical protein
MKSLATLFGLLLTTAFLFGGGDIEPPVEEVEPATAVDEAITTMTTPTTSSSSSTPTLPITSEIEGTSDPKTDLVYLQRETQLIWQDQLYTDDEVAAFKREHASGKAGDYHHAKSYCENLDYAGKVDWRLPTAQELTNIYHNNPKVFTHNKANDFWSSTPATRDRYYVVYPVDAMRYARSARQSNYVRCVRKEPKKP